MAIAQFALQAPFIVVAATTFLIVIGAFFITMGMLGKLKTFGYNYTLDGRQVNLINGKYANIASMLVGLLFVVIALIVFFGSTYG